MMRWEAKRRCAGFRSQVEGRVRSKIGVSFKSLVLGADAMVSSLAPIIYSQKEELRGRSLARPLGAGCSSSRHPAAPHPHLPPAPSLSPSKIFVPATALGEVGLGPAPSDPGRSLGARGGTLGGFNLGLGSGRDLLEIMAQV